MTRDIKQGRRRTKPLSRSTKKQSTVLRETASGLIVFRWGREGLRFLLMYHGNGYWNFPKGKIEGEERSREAAIREVEEETGLRPRDLRVVKNFKAHERFTFYRNRRKIFKLVILYLAETKVSRIRVSSEHAGYGWFSFKEAKAMLLKYKENLSIIKTAHAFLEKSRPRKQMPPSKKRK